MAEAANETDGKEILIVDESRARCEQIRNHLVRLRLGNVSSAECPKQAIDSLKEGSFDLIIVDDNTGLELIRMLKEQGGELVREVRARTKLLFTSPHPTPEMLKHTDGYDCILLKDAERVPLKDAETLDTLGAVVDFSFDPERYKAFREDRESLIKRLGMEGESD